MTTGPAARATAAAPRSDLATGLAVTAVAAVAALWFVPVHTNLAPTVGNDIAPAFMPLVCVGIITVLGLTMVMRALLGRADGPASGGDEEIGRDRATPWQVAADLAVWSVSTVLVLLLLPRLGFVITGGLLLAAWLAYAGLRSWKTAAAVVLVVPAVLDWLCWHALRIQLP